MLLGKCFKLFKEKKNQVEAQIACQNENSKLAEPHTFAESEFLEALVSMELSKASEFPAADIWINVRRSESSTSVGNFVSSLKGHSNGDLLLEEGDCISMKITEENIHLGWHRVDCSINAYYICETSKGNNFWNLN